MQILKKDKFISNIIGHNSFITTQIPKDEKIRGIKKPFFITIKTKKKISLKKDKEYSIILNSRLVNFVRKFKKNLKVNTHCRLAKPQDKLQLLKIVNEKNYNSRFLRDKLLSNKFKNKFKKFWILNYFKNKRGDFLAVSIENKKILGFILLIKDRSFLRIDLIQTGKKFQKRKVASSLINYANNLYLRKDQKIIAGTQQNNNIALKMYKKLGFKRYGKPIYVYHLHNKT